MSFSRCDYPSRTPPICLNESVKKVKIQIKWYRKQNRTNNFDQLHYHIRSQYIPEQPHTQRQRSDSKLQYIDGKHNGNRLGKAFQPPLCPFLVNSGILDQDNAHNRQSDRHTDILCRRYKPEYPHDVRKSNKEDDHRHIRYVACSTLTQQIMKEIAEKQVSGLQRKLLFPRIFYFQVPH